jgi:glycosyltransferase involved in cell wall biosynthesis
LSAARFPDLSLSVVFPAYNEEGNIERTLPRAIAELREQVARFEVIVIDDCSTDRTYAIAEELAREHPEIRLFKNEVNLRQGATLERGFELATLDLVTHNAMDYPFHFSDLPLLLSHFPEADVVVASTNRAMIRGLFGTHFHDYNIIQIYRRAILRRQRRLSTATSFITPEIIIRAHRAGFRVVEVEVDYHRRELGTPSSANFKNITQAMRDMTRLRYEIFRARHFGDRPDPGH